LCSLVCFYLLIPKRDSYPILFPILLVCHPTVLSRSLTSPMIPEQQSPSHPYVFCFSFFSFIFLSFTLTKGTPFCQAPFPPFFHSLFYSSIPISFRCQAHLTPFSSSSPSHLSFPIFVVFSQFSSLEPDSIKGHLEGTIETASSPCCQSYSF
jgi:hypothetical protein